MTSPILIPSPHPHITKSATSRAIAPSSKPRSPGPRMPSPRSSPAMRPQSPLSPRLESQGRSEGLQPPSPRAMNSRVGNVQRRANTNTLKLPQLPRFHPANFPSTHSSASTTPEAGTSSPQPPVSPRTHQRVISDAQRQLLVYQREVVQAARSNTPVQFENPASPRLVPMGSPGPVTPLELEEGDSYLVAGARNAGIQSVPSEVLAEELIEEEIRRSRPRNSRSRSTSR